MAAKVVDCKWVSVELFPPLLNRVKKLISNNPSNVGLLILSPPSVVDGDYMPVDDNWTATVSGEGAKGISNFRLVWLD
jgi:hypothetical protein